jgi:hypothetical protein
VNPVRRRPSESIRSRPVVSSTARRPRRRRNHRNSHAFQRQWRSRVGRFSPKRLTGVRIVSSVFEARPRALPHDRISPSPSFPAVFEPRPCGLPSGWARRNGMPTEPGPRDVNTHHLSISHTERAREQSSRSRPYRTDIRYFTAMSMSR